MTAMTNNGELTSEVTQGIGTVCFYHPQSNSLPGDLLKKLANEITRISCNDDVKVVVLRSMGEKTFCAGASFDELINIDNFEKGKYFFSGFAGVINAMRKCPKFILARVQGKAVGGGVGIIAASDYAIAVNAASVKLSELAVGIGPFVVGPAVERKIGASAFASMSINATEWKDAAWAKEKGLYSEVFSDINLMDEALNLLAAKLAKSNPEAMSLLKKTMWQDTDHWDKLLIERAELSGKLVLSDFTKSAIRQFKTK